MALSSLPADASALVLRLRAAGCVFAEEEAALLVAEAGSEHELEAMTVRRVAGEPLEQVLGWVQFDGRRIGLRPGVFVPRRRTELLLREAISLTRPGAPVVELCCGAAAVACCLAARVPDLELYAADLDPLAVACATENLGSVGQVLVGDLFDPLPAGLRDRIEVLVCNAPYVPSDELALMPAEARGYEPLAALDGGPDGLDVLRRVLAQAQDWLAPTGTLLMETSRRQASTLLAAAGDAGLAGRLLRAPDLDATAVAASRTGPTPGRVRGCPLIS